MITEQEMIKMFSIPVMRYKTDFRLTDNERTFLDTLSIEGDGTKHSKSKKLLELVSLERVKQFFLDMMKQYNDNYLTIQQELYMTTSWFTMNKNTYHEEHNHPNTIFSMAYYPECESGDLQLMDKRHTIFKNFDFEFDYKQVPDFVSQMWNIPVRTGDVVIFPGWVDHKSTLTDTLRVMIGANFFTRGKFGKYSNVSLIEVK
tara:strand:- start:1151 stop:1756 length:606 start_codon:yes stop_codon:yes gene_type:complete